MPRAAASRGPETVTGRPSKRNSPLSIGWIPAIALISVLLPAPLSPTSAVTLPRKAVRCTSCSTWTAPKLLLMPRSSSVGVSSSGRLAGVDTSLPSVRRVRCREATGAPHDDGTPRLRAELLDACRGAHRGVVAGADGAGRLRALADHVGHVVLGDRDRVEQDGGDVALALGVLRRAGGVRLVPLEQRDGRVGQRLRLLVGRLPDGHALVAGQDVLQALDGRVLPGDRDLLVVALQGLDGRIGQRVVGRVQALDVAAGLRVHLLEDRLGLDRVPLGHGLLGDLRVLAVLVEHRVGAVGEQGGVVVVRGAVEVGDAGGLVPQALLEALALQLADLGVVVGHVVVRRAAQGEAVVVEGLHPLLLGLLLDGRTRGVVQVDDRQDGDPVGDHLLRDRLHLLRIAAGILDVVLHTGGLERGLELRPVLALPAGGRRRVGKDHPDLSGGLATAATAARAAGGVGTTAAGGEGEDASGADRRRRQGAPSNHERSPAISLGLQRNSATHTGAGAAVTASTPSAPCPDRDQHFWAVPGRRLDAVVTGG